MQDKGLPLQEGVDDCGIMTLSYAKHLLCDKEMFKVRLEYYKLNFVILLLRI